ncbi:MAG: hypothetical protein WC247_06315 [Porticoccaceae bacterium]
MWSPFHPLHLVLGLIVWAAWFVAMYGGLSVVCSVAPPAPALGARTWINAALLALTAVITALLLIQGWRCWRASAPAGEGSPNQRFIGRVAAGAYLLTAVSTLMIGLPVIVLPPCL